MNKKYLELPALESTSLVYTNFQKWNCKKKMMKILTIHTSLSLVAAMRVVLEKMKTPKFLQSSIKLKEDQKKVHKTYQFKCSRKIKFLLLRKSLRKLRSNLTSRHMCMCP